MTNFNPTRAGELATILEERDKKASPAPWRHADDISPRLVLYHYDADERAEKKFNPIGQAYCDVAQQSRANMKLICDLRNTARETASQLRAAIAEVERLRNRMLETENEYGPKVNGYDSLTRELAGARKEVERLTRQRDAARFAKDARTLAIENQNDTIDALARERDELRAEVERMRAVYEAAKDWQRQPGQEWRREQGSSFGKENHRLWDAIDAALTERDE